MLVYNHYMTKNTQIFIVISILFFALVSRLYRLNLPINYYFDEVYHAFTAKAYANNDPKGYEWWHTSPEEGTAYEWLHPPIAKLFMAGSIKMFGANSFSWRFPGVLFGVLVVYATYIFSFQITKNINLSLVAALLASLDGLLLSQSRIAMNDIYVTAFIVLTLIFYERWQREGQKKALFLTSLFLGLAISTKWSGVFLIGIIGFTEGFLLARKSVKFSLRRYAKLGVALIIIPGIIYFLSYSQFFLQGHTWGQFRELHRQIAWYQFNLDATHSYQSPAWQWPLLIRPVWQSVDYSVPSKISNIYAMGNPLISWLGLAAMLWFIVEIIRNKKYQKPQMILLIVSYFAVWLPWVFSPRIMFYYHYTPAIPFLCIILALSLNTLYKKSEVGKSIAINSLCLITIVFILLYPHWVGMPVSKTYSDWLFWIPSWR